jgi:hypothetical protein
VGNPLGLAVEDRHDAVRLEDAVGECGEIVQKMHVLKLVRRIGDDRVDIAQIGEHRAEIKKLAERMGFEPMIRL